jgi:D-alanine-D-alanine ligase
LEFFQIPYTGSGVLASALAMDKTMAKRLFRSAGIAVPEGIDGHAKELLGTSLYAHGLEVPLVVKPRDGGSSIGVTLVRIPDDFDSALTCAARHGSGVLVERLVVGTEVHVAVLEDRALGAVEVVPGTAFYDYEAKYERKDTQYFVPARLEPVVYDRALRVALQGHRALGCRGLTRSDLIITSGGSPVLLEVNTNPGMTATSLVPKIARSVGMSFEELCGAQLTAVRLGP